ncbi:MAG TPA: 2-phosphosulfolactate phosphatase [Candidatus Angelobacter sp.]|nr:2-phosphosulfolactate phosphatase [Candidatus Angelobacter sp.]
MSVIIDSFPSSNGRYQADYAIVAVDVIRASTTVVTAATLGRKCFPVTSVEEALQKRAELPDCLLAGEVAGIKPDGFDLNNSPSHLARRTDVHRPLVLLSSSGTKLMVQSGATGAAYVACLRNYKAVAAHIGNRHERIALLGAATQGEFREEDQLCCAWIANELRRFGHQPENQRTLNLIEQWRRASARACATGNSAAYLRRSNQLDDLNFVLAHVNDVPLACQLVNGEVLPITVISELPRPKPPAARRRLAA